MLLYLYKYIYIYIYIYIKKNLYPTAWIIQVQGNKTWLRRSQQSGPFSSFPELPFLLFFLPIVAYGDHELPRILLYNAFVLFSE